MASSYSYCQVYVLSKIFTLSAIPRQRRQKYLLAFLSAITRNGVVKLVPGNGARNACWYFLTFTDKIRKHTENTIVALHLESIQGIVFSQETEV